MILDFADPEIYQFNWPISGSRDLFVAIPETVRTNDEKDNTPVSSITLLYVTDAFND